jgi:hypothetical protein
VTPEQQARKIFAKIDAALQANGITTTAHYDAALNDVVALCASKAEAIAAMKEAVEAFTYRYECYDLNDEEDGVFELLKKLVNESEASK